MLYLNEGEYYMKGDKIQMTTSFYVNHIEYDNDGNICGLEVRDKQGQVRFTFPKTR